MDALAFDDLKLFARVVALGTFSAAARERNVPVSQVSRSIARMEGHCGAKLLHRSTHALALTPEGETFLRYCRELTRTLDDLEGEFAGHSGTPSGLVRVAVSTLVAEWLIVPSLQALSTLHPRVQIELDVNDRVVEIARGGIDIAIRSGLSLPDNVVARRLGTLQRALYAAPAYAKRAGLPAHPRELAAHTLIANSAETHLNNWPFVVDGEPLVLPTDGWWRTGGTTMVVQMVLAGLGIGRIASLAARPLVAAGRLLPVLPEFVDASPMPLWAVTAGARHRLPKVKACLDFWQQWAKAAEAEEAPVPGSTS